MSTGQRIRTIRTGLIWTQAQCAVRLGVGQPRWADIERDRHDPTLGMLRRIADVLGVPVSALLAREKKL